VVPSNEISRSCRKLVKFSGLAPFTPHDLRRTAISIMAEAGVDGDIRRRITGHQATDVHGKIYDRALRLDGMRAALLTIEGHYTAAASKAASEAVNVVSISTSRKRG
jgi:integrase